MKTHGKECVEHFKVWGLGVCCEGETEGPGYCS